MKKKRIFDITISIILLVVLFPVFIVIYLLIRTNLGKPVIFNQLRPGYKAKPFTLYKFRTMKIEYDRHHNLLSDDKRLNKLGIFLRTYSLDELPSLWNVLIGDLSLVGPRPLLMEYIHLYSRRQFKRHDVMPGITGWAQVNGRNSISWNKKFELDLWYVKNQTFWLDLKIFFLTIYKVFFQRDDFVMGNKTLAKFKGNNTSNLELEEKIVKKKHN